MNSLGGWARSRKRWSHWSQTSQYRPAFGYQAKRLQHELELWDHSRSEDCRARALSVALSLASSLETITAALPRQPTRPSSATRTLAPYPARVGEIEDCMRMEQ